MRAIIESWFLRQFLGFTDSATEVKIRRRIALLVGLSVIGIFFLLVFGLVSLIQEKRLLMALDLGAALILLINLIDARCRKKYDVNILIGIFVASLLYIMLYALGGNYESTFVWYYTYPLIAFCVLGAKKGKIAALLMTLPVFTLMTVSDDDSIFTNYDPDFEIRFIISYLVVVAFTYLIEKAREENETELKSVNLSLEKEVQRRTMEIYNANQNLLAEIEKSKSAAKKIQLSNDSFLTILNSIDATIYVADLDTYEIIFMNKYMIETFGKDMTGQTCWKSFRGDKSPCVDCPREKILDKNNNPIGVHSWQEKNPLTGQWLIRNDRAVRWIDGRVVHLQVAADITRLKEMEEQLLQAQKMESIGHLAGGIAHDFNNILCPIIGWSEMLIEDLPDESQDSQHAEKIMRAGLRGRDLVNQILAFSRQTDNEFVSLRLQPIIKEVLSLGRSTIPSNIEILKNIDPNCPSVNANATQIHQIAMNLITNAYHAVEPNSGKISIKLRQVTLDDTTLQGQTIPPGRYAKLSISDNGPGIEPTDIKKIFDPYFTTKERGKGTGLGLAVAYGIAKEHQGEITVRSELGKGARFDLYLPITEATKESTREKEVFGRCEDNIRIMLVDDENANVEVMGQILRRLGYQVKTYTGSVEALDAFKRDPDRFDLVITDMTMPRMTGERLSKELISIKPEIPIIIYTGYSEKMDQERAMAIGAKGFLMKPVAKADMNRTVHEVLCGPKG